MDILNPPTREEIDSVLKGLLRKRKRPLSTVEALEDVISQLYDSINFHERIKTGRELSSKLDEQVLAKVQKIKTFCIMLRNPQPETAYAIMLQYYKVSRTLEICKKREEDLKVITPIGATREKRVRLMKKENGYETAKKSKDIFDLVLNYRIIEEIDAFNAQTVERYYTKVVVQQ